LLVMQHIPEAFSEASCCMTDNTFGHAWIRNAPICGGLSIHPRTWIPEGAHLSVRQRLDRSDLASTFHNMRPAMARSLVASFLVLAGAGCGEPPPPQPFVVAVRVESDRGVPVAGANVTRGDRPLGTTGADGLATLKIAGAEGETAEVTVACPEGFQSPPKPASIRLTRLAEKSKVPEYSVACPPLTRRVVVAIRADNGPNLPVVYLDKTVTRTDASGAASFALEMPPGSQFTVALNTSERKDIKPINPSRLFVVTGRDEIFLFDQKFDVEKKKPPPPPVVRMPRALN